MEGACFVNWGERKLVSSVDRSFCFAGHFANDERKKERKKEFIGFLKSDARALLLPLPISPLLPCMHGSLLLLLMRSSCCHPICRLLVFLPCKLLVRDAAAAV